MAKGIFIVLFALLLTGTPASAGKKRKLGQDSDDSDDDSEEVRAAARQAEDAERAERVAAESAEAGTGTATSSMAPAEAGAVAADRAEATAGAVHAAAGTATASTSAAIGKSSGPIGPKTPRKNPGPRTGRFSDLVQSLHLPPVAKIAIHPPQPRGAPLPKVPAWNPAPRVPQLPILPERERYTWHAIEIYSGGSEASICDWKEKNTLSMTKAAAQCLLNLPDDHPFEHSCELALGAHGLPGGPELHIALTHDWNGYSTGPFFDQVEAKMTFWQGKKGGQKGGSKQHRATLVTCKGCSPLWPGGKGPGGGPGGGPPPPPAGAGGGITA